MKNIQISYGFSKDVSEKVYEGINQAMEIISEEIRSGILLLHAFPIDDQVRITLKMAFLEVDQIISESNRSIGFRDLSKYVVKDVVYEAVYSIVSSNTFDAEKKFNHYKALKKDMIGYYTTDKEQKTENS